MSSRAVAAGEDRDHIVNGLKDGSLGFVGDVLSFNGEIHFKTMLRIDGKFSGQVTSSGGTLIISSGAQVTGAVINVAAAKINGTVEGEVNASGQLMLGRTAKVVGALTAGELVVEEGALFDGSCRSAPSRHSP